jgi:hypothetical protein
VAIPRKPNHIAELTLWLVAVALIGGGVLTHRYASKDWHPPADALIIAGVLALTVDRYVKLRLREEIARDVFYAALGIYLPTEMKDEILAIGECKLVRKNMVVTCTLTCKEGYVVCETTSEYQLENLTSRRQPFDHRVWVARPIPSLPSPDTPIPQVKAVVASGGYDHKLTKTDLAEEQFRWTWQAPAPVIVPRKSTADFSATTTQFLSFENEDKYEVLVPTIGITVNVSAPPELVPYVAFEHRSASEFCRLSPGSWRLDAAFLPNSFFRVGWKRKSPAVDG